MLTGSYPYVISWVSLQVGPVVTELFLYLRAAGGKNRGHAEPRCARGSAGRGPSHTPALPGAAGQDDGGVVRADRSDGDRPPRPDARHAGGTARRPRAGGPGTEHGGVHPALRPPPQARPGRLDARDPPSTRRARGGG